MIRAKPWNGKDLKGDWQVTYKIDGVRALWNFDEERWESRAGKPLYNLAPPPLIKGGYAYYDCEVYCGTPGMTSAQRFKRTIQMVRSKSGKYGPILPQELYSLEPLDERLQYRTGRPFGIVAPGQGEPISNPSAETIRGILKMALVRGVEGIVLRQGDKWLKVKPLDTYDVKVTGWIAGRGKHMGKLGALTTNYGNVGTGFSDSQRHIYWGDSSLIGSIIEVSCMSITADGKFRHPRFIRLRPDKNEESPPEKPEP